MPTPDRSARRFARSLVAASAVLLVVTGLPYLYAFASAPADRVYTGLMADVPDHAQYWSWVTASREGLFISNTMTPEPNPPIFMNPWMWLLAQAQQALGLSFPALFQLWRIVAVVLLVAALLWFVGTLAPDEARRRTALVIALFGAGFGWVLIVVKFLAGLSDAPFPFDIYTYEPNTFFGILSYPYQPLAQGLLLVAMTSAWLAHRRGRWYHVAGAGLAALSLALFHAYDLITLYGVLGVFGLAVWIRHRRFPSRLFVTGLAIAALSGPVAVYYRNLTASDPLWEAILGQYGNAGAFTPSPPHLIVLMGAPLLLAAAGLRRRPAGDAHVFLASWMLTSALLIYVPTVYQIKLLLGWQFPIALLAADAWHSRLLPWLEHRLRHISGWTVSRTRLAGGALLALLILPTNVYLFTWRFVELSRYTRPYFLHRDEMAALEWLARHATHDDVVLAPLELGQFVPSYGRARAFVAHWAMTNRFYERDATARRFFSDAPSAAWQSEVLTTNGITLVLDAPGRSTVEASPLSTLPTLDRVFAAERAAVYRHRPLPGSAARRDGHP